MAGRFSWLPDFRVVVRCAGRDTQRIERNRRFSSLTSASEDKKIKRINFEPVARQRVPRNHWKQIENQRKFFEDFAMKHNIKQPSDWRKTTSTQIANEGGRTILRQYQSLFSALQTIYPEYKWDPKSIPTAKPKKFWKNIFNQRCFFDELAIKYNIKSQSDWNNITYSLVVREGGKTLLKNYSSLLSALQTLYPEYKWSNNTIRTKVTQGYWENIKNQRKFFESLERKLQITKPDDWSHVKYQQVINEGGRPILDQYPSLFLTLKAIYPEHEWNSSIRQIRMPNNHWDDVDNQRKFFDEFAMRHNIKQERDWRQVTYTQIASEGGKPILNHYSSLLATLEALYPDKKWKEIIQTSKPISHWESLDNVKEFIENLKNIFQIKQNDDWYRVSVNQVIAEGGRSLMVKYGSLWEILVAVYPEIKWNKKKLQNRFKRASQRWMFIQIQKIYPNNEVIEEYLHEELSRASGQPIELDVFVPACNIAFEYQGEHHYQDSPALGCGFIELHQDRDAEKVLLCKQHGITLVAVPYWWNNTLESLEELIAFATKQINQEAKCEINR